MIIKLDKQIRIRLDQHELDELFSIKRIASRFSFSKQLFLETEVVLLNENAESQLNTYEAKIVISLNEKDFNDLKNKTGSTIEVGCCLLEVDAWSKEKRDKKQRR